MLVFSFLFRLLLPPLFNTLMVYHHHHGFQHIGFCRQCTHTNFFFSTHKWNTYIYTEGWGKIDFTWSIQNWIKYKNLYHIIDISCNTCEKHPTLDLFSLDYGYRPFIVVNTTSSQTIKRQRRSINCSPGISECCRDKLYISFAEIGWNDWILHPAGYDAYFCRGSCASAATITSNASYYNLLVRVS